MSKAIKQDSYLTPLFKVGEAIRGALRIDNWQNLLTGLGTSRDKTVYGRFLALNRIDERELTALYHQSADARKIVAFKPREMLRQGFRINIPEDEEAVAGLTKKLRALKVARHFVNGMIWGRLYGGAAIVLGANDGRAADTPLQEDRIQSLKFMHVVDRRHLIPEDFFDDPLEDEFFGEAEVYRLVPRRGGNAVRIHRSRLILFGGAHTSDEERDRLGGWDYSIIDVVYAELRAFWSVWKSAEHLMADASQAVFKLQGLMAMIAGGQKDILQQRLEIVDMSRSVARAVMLDADNEDFIRQPSSFTDAAQMLDKFMLRLASVADIPVTILMGQSPAGMNATGDADFQHFYDNIKSAQENDLRPELERAVRLCLLAQDGPTGGEEPEDWTLTFESLWQLTPAEQATAEKTRAETDKLYLDAGVVLPEEIALSRFRKDGWSPETNIDRDVREVVLKAELEDLEEGATEDPEATAPMPGMPAPVETETAPQEGAELAEGEEPPAPEGASEPDEDTAPQEGAELAEETDEPEPPPPPAADEETDEPEPPVEDEPEDEDEDEG